MKYLAFLLVLLSLQARGQISGNPHVNDSSALRLDAEAKKILLGKWKLLHTVETIRNEEQKRDRGILLNIGKDHLLISSWCIGCHEQELGQWEILNEQVLRIRDRRSDENNYLAGDWVVYTLTDQELVLAKVLTSSGDWRKLHYFSRDVEDPPLTETSRYCRNCTDDGAWCWGDRPEGARQQWALLHDLLNSTQNQTQPSAELEAHFDWLLHHAPCINSSLYLLAATYYTGLLDNEKKQEAKQAYQAKLEQIKKQQRLYFEQ